MLKYKNHHTLILKHNQSWQNLQQQLSIHKQTTNIRIHSSLLPSIHLSHLFANIQHLQIIKCHVSQFVISAPANQLQRIDLSHNEITHIHPSIGQCKSLTQLILTSNSINSLSNQLLALSSIRNIEVYGNPLIQFQYQLFHELCVCRQVIKYQWIDNNFMNTNLCQWVAVKDIMCTNFHSATVEYSLKKIIYFENIHLLNYVKSLLPTEECERMATIAKHNHKYKIMTQLTTDSYPPQRMASLKIEELAHVSDLQTMCEGLLLIPQSYQHQVHEYVNRGEFRTLLNSLINSEDDLEMLLGIVANENIIRQIICSEGIYFLQEYGFQDLDILKYILEMDCKEVVMSLNKFYSFQESIYHNSFWRRIVKSNWKSYHLHYKYEKQYVKTMTESTLLHLPEYKRPQSLVLWNDVHDYDALQEYQLMQCSSGNKEYKLIVKFTNKENYFSIAKKIDETLHHKKKRKGISTTKNKENSWVDNSY